MTTNTRVFAAGKILNAHDILDISSENFKVTKLHATFVVLLFQTLHNGPL